jgi:uncharacterized protein (DUF2141 family)
MRRIFLLLLVLLAACAPETKQQLTIKLEVPVSKIGKQRVVLNISRDGQPLEGATVSVQGDMTHAGMGTVYDTATALGGGRYAVAKFDFNMSGDWVLTVTAKKDRDTLTGEVRFGVNP